MALTKAMTLRRIEELRQETVSMFYHGFDNYMNIAFPEDEVGFLQGGSGQRLTLQKRLGQFLVVP